MSQRLKIKPKAKAAHQQNGAPVQVKFQQALRWQQQGQWSQAQRLFEEILLVQPNHLDALYLLGVIAVQTGDLSRAAAIFTQTIAINPHNATLHFNRGVALQGLKKLAAALASFDQAIALKPDYAAAFLSRGNVLSDLGQLEAAVASYGQAIAIEPGYAAAYNNRGLVRQQLRQLAAALADYDQALAIQPDYAEACFNRGIVLQQLNRLEAALASYDRATAIAPGYAAAYNNRGLVRQELKQLEAALADYDQAIALAPDYIEAHNNRGNVLDDFGQPEAALVSYDRAIAIRPDHAEAHYNRGLALYKLKQHQAALASYDKALALKPDYEFLSGLRFHLRMQICDWQDWQNQLAELINKIQRHEKAATPGFVLALSGSLPLQRKVAEIYTNGQYPANGALGNIPRRPRGPRIRVGYFSGDFRNHAVAFLTAELFELHDRQRFEVVAFSFGPDTRDEMRQRLEGAFDKFIEVRHKSDQEIAELARLMEIDIAIDLAGCSAEARTGIFAFRAAPIQINFLGYPGTMGCRYMDYLIADRQGIPEEAKAHYAEKIVFLPSFQPNDRKRKISAKLFARADLGLPQAGFVYCCFNNNYKITPGTFAGWIRILTQVAGSVLWLLADNPTAADNLRKEAARRGVDPQRLVFAERVPISEHLARHRLADLFLDTLPCNAGITASDALWAGLPVLTCSGEAFAGRMATSLLAAIDLPEMITTTQGDYEALAVELANNPGRLTAIKEKLERHRLTTQLFDSRLYARHLEDAFMQMDERHQAGLPPDHIPVASQVSGDRPMI